MTYTLILLAVVLLIAAHKFGLTLDSNDSVFGGVCAGIGHRFNMAPNLVRVITVALAVGTDGFFLLLYVGLWLTLPTVDRSSRKTPRKNNSRKNS